MLTGNDKARIRNTLSDLYWYACRMAWYDHYFVAGGETLKDRAEVVRRKITIKPGSSLEMIFNFIDELENIPNLSDKEIKEMMKRDDRDECPRLLRKIWIYLHEFDKQLSER